MSRPGQVNLEAFTREAARLQRTARESQRAVQRAAGTLARRLPVAARRDIQEEYNLKAGRINQGLRVTRGRGYVELWGAKRGIGLIEFGGKWGGRRTPGATALRRHGAPESYRGAFIARLVGGNRHIVERAGPRRTMTMGRYRGKQRQPLHVLYGPSVAMMLRNRGRRERLADTAQEVLDAEMTRLLGRGR